MSTRASPSLAAENRDASRAHSMRAHAPDARFKVRARVAVRMHPGLAGVLAEPGGVPGSASVNVDGNGHTGYANSK